MEALGELCLKQYQLIFNTEVGCTLLALIQPRVNSLASFRQTIVSKMPMFGGHANQQHTKGYQNRWVSTSQVLGIVKTRIFFDAPAILVPVWVVLWHFGAPAILVPVWVFPMEGGQ